MSEETKTRLDPSQTWGYYNKLELGREHDSLGEEWFEAGELGDASFKDGDSIQRLHQNLDSFNRTLQASPDDTRYEFVVVPTRTRITPENKDEASDLIILVRLTTDDVTLDDLRKFTGQVKGEQNQ